MIRFPPIVPRRDGVSSYRETNTPHNLCPIFVVGPTIVSHFFEGVQAHVARLFEVRDKFIHDALAAPFLYLILDPQEHGAALFQLLAIEAQVGHRQRQGTPPARSGSEGIACLHHYSKLM